MSVPKSVIKVKKKEVEYTSSIDYTKYTMRELIRAALRDTGKFICNRTRQYISRRTGRLAKNIQYWVRKRDMDLQVGFKPNGFYGGFQELGTSKTPKIGALSKSTQDNVGEIIKIQSQYLSALNSKSPNIPISKGDYKGE